MKSIVCSPKKTIFARFDEGDDLILSLKKCAEQHNIKTGWFNLIGGLKEFAYALYEKGEYRNIHERATHCFELLPTFGNITQKEGETLIHAHIIASDEDAGVAKGGHLIEGCKIYPFAEVLIQEIDAVIDRSYDKNTNLWPVRFE